MGLSVGFLQPFVIALLVTAATTPLSGRLATRLGIVARPKNDRWNSRTVPMLGGLAIVCGIVAAAVLSGVSLGAARWALLAACVMCALGLADDVIRMKPSSKLTGQILVACGLVVIVPISHWTGAPAINTLLAILWLVALTNALNLLDNMDGLCSGIALIAGLSLLFTAADPATRTIAAAIVGSCGGFLLYNFQPASIFMGDCGSLFLGCLLSALVLTADTPYVRRGLLSTTAVPVLLLMLPIFDTTLVLISRKLSSRAASQGGRDHTSHRLVAMGFSERQAVVLCYGVAAAAGFTAILIDRTSLPGANTVLALLVLVLLLFAVQLARVNIYDGNDFTILRKLQHTPLVVELMYKRRILEVVLDVCIVTISYYLAYEVRFDRDLPQYYAQFEQSLPVVIACELMAFFVVGVYRGVWRYISIADVSTYLKAVLAGTLLSVVMIVYLHRFDGYSRGVFVIFAMALAILLIGSRAFFRLLGETAARHSQEGQPALVYGAGDGAALLVRELRNKAFPYRPVALLDDDPAKANATIHGIRVVGGSEQLADAITRFRPDVLIVSTRKVEKDRMYAIERTCFESGTALLRLHVELQEVGPKAIHPGPGRI